MRTFPRARTVVTGPATEPLTVAEAKTHLRVEVSGDDTYIGNLIVRAREVAQRHTQRALMQQTLEAHYDAWPTDGALWVPDPPLQSVTSVKYYDADGVQQTLSSTNYQVDTYSQPGRIDIKAAYSWPALQYGAMVPITVRYVAGYASADAVPGVIKQAMLLMIGKWYEERKDVITGTIVADLPNGASSLLDMEAVTWGF